MVAQIEITTNVDVEDVGRRIARYGGEIVYDGKVLIGFGVDEPTLRGVIERSGAAAPEPPTAADVRQEARRRIMILTQARDAEHLDVIVSNGTREAVRLLRKGNAGWSAEEAERAAALEIVDVAIEAIRTASNAIEAEPPADYADDKYWPQLPAS